MKEQRQNSGQKPKLKVMRSKDKEQRESIKEMGEKRESSKEIQKQKSKRYRDIQGQRRGRAVLSSVLAVRALILLGESSSESDELPKVQPQVSRRGISTSLSADLSFLIYSTHLGAIPSMPRI